MLVGAWSCPCTPTCDFSIGMQRVEGWIEERLIPVHRSRNGQHCLQSGLVALSNPPADAFLLVLHRQPPSTPSSYFSERGICASPHSNGPPATHAVERALQRRREGSRPAGQNGCLARSTSPTVGLLFAYRVLDDHSARCLPFGDLGGVCVCVPVPMSVKLSRRSNYVPAELKATTCSTLSLMAIEQRSTQQHPVCTPL